MTRQKSPNPIDKHVGSRVRMRRVMLNMSQSGLGDALGITFPLPGPSTDSLTDLMATRDGLALAEAFMRIGNIQLRRRIVSLVEEIEEHQD